MEDFLLKEYTIIKPNDYNVVKINKTKKHKINRKLFLNTHTRIDLKDITIYIFNVNEIRYWPLQNRNKTEQLNIIIFKVDTMHTHFLMGQIYECKMCQVEFYISDWLSAIAFRGVPVGSNRGGFDVDWSNGVPGLAIVSDEDWSTGGSSL